MFYTENERKIIDFLNDCPKEYGEIVKFLKRETVKDRRTVNTLLKELESRRAVFRVEVNDRIFYRLNDFPDKIQLFFYFVDSSESNNYLFEVKNDVLSVYPTRSFENILGKHIEFLKIFNPELEDVIQLLKDFKVKKYNRYSRK